MILVRLGNNKPPQGKKKNMRKLLKYVFVGIPMAIGFILYLPIGLTNMMDEVNEWRCREQ